jgi:hypothetical protein
MGGYNIRDLVRGRQRQPQQQRQQRCQHGRAAVIQENRRQQQEHQQGLLGGGAGEMGGKRDGRTTHHGEARRPPLLQDREEEDEEEEVVWNRRIHRVKGAGGGRRKVAGLSLSGVSEDVSPVSEEQQTGDEEEEELEPPGLTLRPTPESVAGMGESDQSPDDGEDFEESLRTRRRRGGRCRPGRLGRSWHKAEAEEQQQQGGDTEVVDLVSDGSEEMGGCGPACAADGSDCHEDECAVCGLVGELLMCDSCPRVFHLECVGLQCIPEGDWFCDQCG